MSETFLKCSMLVIASVFTLFFGFYVLPAFLATFDLLGAFSSGFVNPFSTGYSVDVILCWLVLAVWVVYEARNYSVRHGWLCLVLGVVPGVVVGLALYLLLRNAQLEQMPRA